MSKPTPQFSPEAIAQIAVVILSRPLSMNTGMTFQTACGEAHNLLVAAARSNDERAASLEARRKVDEACEADRRANHQVND